MKYFFLVDNVAQQIGKIYTTMSTSSNACFDQNVKMMELLTSFMKNENTHVMEFSHEDRNIFRNTFKDLKLEIISSMERASHKISSGKTMFMKH